MEIKEPLEGSGWDPLCERVSPCLEVRVNGSSLQPYTGKTFAKASGSSQRKTQATVLGKESHLLKL